MEQAPQSSKISTVFKVSFLLILLSTLVLLILGNSLRLINKQNKEIDYFLESAKNVQPNFERSLLIYTENTKTDIDYVHTLRPKNESEYIDFISNVEDIGQELSLNVALQTMDSSKILDTTGSNFIDYKINFYCTRDQLSAFLNKIEETNYYTRVINMSYRTYEVPDSSEVLEAPNASLTLRLYVK